MRVLHGVCVHATVLGLVDQASGGFHPGYNSSGRVKSSSNVGMVPGLSGYDSYEHTPVTRGQSSGGDNPVGS
jgi:hypothetical protein